MSEHTYTRTWKVRNHWWQRPRTLSANITITYDEHNRACIHRDVLEALLAEVGIR